MFKDNLQAEMNNYIALFDLKKQQYELNRFHNQNDANKIVADFAGLYR